MDLILLGLAGGLVMAIGAGAIARSKNRSFFGYFLIGLFFPFIGLLIAMGMAPRPAPDGRANSSGFMGGFQWLVLIGCGALVIYAISKGG